MVSVNRATGSFLTCMPKKQNFEVVIVSVNGSTGCSRKGIPELLCRHRVGQQVNRLFSNVYAKIGNLSGCRSTGQQAVFEWVSQSFKSGIWCWVNWLQAFWDLLTLDNFVHICCWILPRFQSLSEIKSSFHHSKDCVYSLENYIPLHSNDSRFGTAYIQNIEFGVPVWNSSLTQEQVRDIERVKKKILHVLLGEEYED